MHANAYRSVKYWWLRWSKAISVSPPPGGSAKLAMLLGGGPGLITRNVCALSTDPYHTLRWVPVPVGPLTKTRPVGSIPMSGSPAAWMGSTTVGTLKRMLVAAPDAVIDGSNE